MALTFDIITIFPRLFEGLLGESIIARARKAGLVDVRITNLRDYTEDRHRSAFLGDTWACFLAAS